MEKNHMYAEPVPQRLISLDALRGFDMFWIIGGSAIAVSAGRTIHSPGVDTLLEQFQHVPWQGLHFYDIIWPLFMFIVGVSLPFSLAKRKAAGAGIADLYLHALKRAAILFLLGMAAQGNLLAFDLAKLRPCYSVLHGIAAGYLIATIVTVHLRPAGQAITIAVFLLTYWAVLMLVPVPGVGAGVLTPEGNVATYVDQLILGRFHFGQNTWFLSYPGFASSILLGVLAGELLMCPRSGHWKGVVLFAGGAGLVLLGLLWSLALPIIKLLWTSSFVLAGGGLSCLLLAGFYMVIDVWGLKRWAFPFIVIGMNSIAVYMATMLFSFRQIGNVFVGNLLPRLGEGARVLESSAAFLVVWLILYWMFRTKTFLKI